MSDNWGERIDIAEEKVVNSARRLIRTTATGIENSVAYAILRDAVLALETLERSRAEELEGEAVDRLLERVGHVEGCDYTLKATAGEMAVHAALFLANGGPLSACGDPEWWPHGGIPPDLPSEAIPVRIRPTTLGEALIEAGRRLNDPPDLSTTEVSPSRHTP